MKVEDTICPVCGWFCLGKGGVGCIDKPALCGLKTEKALNGYQKLIADWMFAAGIFGVDPRHVEAWIRLERPTLDALDEREFKRLVRDAVAQCVGTSTGESERLAMSMGL